MPFVDLQAVQFPGSLQVHAYLYGIALSGRGMEGNLMDIADLGGSEAPLAHLA